jgi:membrane protease YdiL (CAAX protease family)
VVSKGWGELWAVYGAMLGLTVVVGWAQELLPWVASYGLLITALAFVYLPTEVLLRRGEDPRRSGVGVGRPLPALRGALWVSLLTLAPYAVGYHLWQRAEGRAPRLEWVSLTQWGEDLRGAPPLRSLEPGEVRLYAERDALTLRWRLLPGERALSARLEGWGEARVVARSSGVQLSRRLAGAEGAGEGGRLEVGGGAEGWIGLTSPVTQVGFEVRVDGAQLQEGRLRLGALRVESASVGEGRRDAWWLLLTLITQLLLVAIPEEVFYRGYLQTRLDRLIGRDREVFGALFNWESALVCSALFAVAHVATIPHPARLAVFFPSLLFGWMRRAYGDTLTPAIYHALCNLAAQVLWGLYAHAR